MFFVFYNTILKVNDLEKGYENQSTTLFITTKNA